MDQVIKLAEGHGHWGGAAADEMVDCYKLAEEVFGEACKDENGGLILNSYLYRRFGPTAHGSDDYKELCCYWLSTSDPEVVLCVSPKGIELPFCFSYLATEEIRIGTKAELEKLRKANAVRSAKFEKWWVKNHPEHDMNNWKKKTKEQKEAIEHAFRLDYWHGTDAKKAGIGKFPRRDARAASRRVQRALKAAMRELLRPAFIRDVAVNALGRVKDAGVSKEAPRSKYAGFGVDLKTMDAAIAREA